MVAILKQIHCLAAQLAQQRGVRQAFVFLINRDEINAIELQVAEFLQLIAQCIKSVIACLQPALNAVEFAFFLCPRLPVLSHARQQHITFSEVVEYRQLSVWQCHELVVVLAVNIDQLSR